MRYWPNLTQDFENDYKELKGELDRLKAYVERVARDLDKAAVEKFRLELKLKQMEIKYFDRREIQRMCIICWPFLHVLSHSVGFEDTDWPAFRLIEHGCYLVDTLLEYGYHGQTDVAAHSVGEDANRLLIEFLMQENKRFKCEGNDRIGSVLANGYKIWGNEMTTWNSVVCEGPVVWRSWDEQRKHRNWDLPSVGVRMI
jgi:hypothetical protein